MTNQGPFKERVIINEGMLKKNMNPPPPSGERPPPPKAQVATPPPPKAPPPKNKINTYVRSGCSCNRMSNLICKAFPLGVLLFSKKK